MQKGGLQDQILRNYIDSVFAKYDKKNTGKLNELEMAYFFNELFMQLGIHHIVTPAQAKQAMKTFDQNNDGFIDKKQLFFAFKYLMNTPPPYPTFIGNPYYPNSSSENFFSNQCTKANCHCSKHQKENLRPYRNTF